MSSCYDIIVCGAGPSGACAGYVAASTGLKTLILERRKLPRYKTCGGGVPISVSGFLKDLVPDAFVEAKVTRLRHTWKFKDAHTGALNPDPLDEPMSLWMVQRSVFDNALTERAASAGCDVRDDTQVVRIDRTASNKLSVTTSMGEVYNCNYVIGADGANGPTARSCGLRLDRPMAIGLEAEIAYQWDGSNELLAPDLAHLEYAVPKGYGWVFPKENHLSIGAGVFGQRTIAGLGASRKSDLVEWVLGYVKALSIPCDASKIEFHGHPLPIWNGSEPVEAWDGRVLLVGDAAGMINPLFGDGISYACRTGALAAELVASGNSAQWTERVKLEFGPGMDSALRIAKFFYQFPYLCYKMGVKHPRGTRLAGRLIAGDLGFDEIIDRLPWKNQFANEHDRAW